jgi:Xaa-Pro aminopeptidase
MDQQSERHARLIHDLLAAERLDAVVLGMPANVLWLSGFDMVGTFYFTAALATAMAPPALLVHRAELDMARSEAWVDDVAVWGHGEDHVDALGSWLAAHLDGGLAGRRVGVELDDWLRPRDLDAIAERLGLAWVDVGPRVEALRELLDDEDHARVADAGRIADMALAVGASAVAVGRSEQAIAGEALRCYALAGGQEPPVALSVRSGPRVAIAQALPSGRAIEAGDPLAIEVWASLRRRAAVAATTVVAGPPSPSVLRAWSALDAVFAAVEQAVPGSSGDELWCAAEAAARGHGAQLAAPAGHGLAFAFPLRPTTRWRLAPEGGALRAGQVVCVAPAVRDDDRAAVFAARTYRAGADGLAPLTHRPELWSVGA